MPISIIRVKLDDDITLTVNQAFYQTHINNPLMAITVSTGTSFANASYHTNSYGTDTYIRLQADELELYLGYNHTVSREVKLRVKRPK